MIRVRIAATGLLTIGSLILTAHQVTSSAGTQSAGVSIHRRRHRPPVTIPTTVPPVTVTAPPTTGASPTPTTVVTVPTPATTKAPAPTTAAATTTTKATAAPTTVAAPPTTQPGPATTAPAPAGTAVRGGGMPLLSRSLPAFASSSAANGTAAMAHDASNTSTWTSTAIPAWLAYDLSSVPVAQRQQSLVAIYAERANDYDNTGTVADWQQMPVDYTIETNTAPGGGNAPTSGWTAIVTVKANVLAAPHHLVQLGGANWLRVNVTRAGGSSTVSLDVDVYAAPNGATDDWLFLGDSITSMTMQRLFQSPSLTQLVNTRDPARWPGQIGGGIGGTNTNTALTAIDARLAAFPGKYVVLAYGTNDSSSSFRMEALVQKVIAAGKTPVVPHVPWSNTKAADIQQMNVMIDALYVKYPQILRGPDLYGLTLNRTDYIPSGDVHPTEAGRTAFRAAYAAIM